MLFTEWNLDDALAVRYEEGVEDGIEKGREELFALLEKGVSLAEAKKLFHISTTCSKSLGNK